MTFMKYVNDVCTVITVLVAKQVFNLSMLCKFNIITIVDLLRN